ncbi:ladinin-1 isoform X1 [Alosa sapidissima]|uniref:ladinin-1 isoform X1 n=1 Tax=Alosa sapidissima TaxID=34773 RepID=UPI001C09AC48|nr:ladinin-1 isoform X1 [Alosa sapidissima]XP_041955081.1 ladinin-1 isoform X1 [Alosa sapidissima]
MSVSRKNWSALSSLARQWTMEDEEELERERRRKTRDPSVSADPDEEEGLASEKSQGSRRMDVSELLGTRKQGHFNTSKHASSAQPEPSDQGDKDESAMQEDFVEMLRLRDERRRARHVETLRRQKQEEEEGPEEGGPEAQPRVELLGDVDLTEALINPLRILLDRDRPTSPTSPKSPASPASTSSSHSRSQSSHSTGEAQNENRNANSDQSTPTKTSRKFVSSFSISFDKSPVASPPQRLVSPLSPRSAPQRPFSPTFGGAQSPTQNGDAENSTAASIETTTKPAFTRQSSRTTSFRLLKKQEEQSMPLQRSASVRVTSKIESNKSPNQDEQQQSPFQRNSKQRISARSIQEKMERLAQASQKQTSKSPYQPERTLFLMDEVLRKKNLFESEQPKGQKEPGMGRQDFRNFSSGISDRINRWLQKQPKPSPTSTTSDLRNVDILSKKILFERGKDERPLSPEPHSKSSN